MPLKSITKFIESLFKKAIDVFGVLSDQYDFYAAIVTIATVAALFLLVYVTFKMEKNRLYFGFLVLLSVIAIWSFSDLQKYLAGSPVEAMPWIRTEYLARLYSAVAWYIFSEVYTKRKEKLNTHLMVIFFAITSVFFGMFSFSHPSFNESRILNARNLQMLSGFLLTTFIIIYSIVRLNRFAYKQKGIFVKQVQLITAGAFFVILIDTISSLRLTSFRHDLVPFGFLMFEFFIWKAITKYRLMEVIPIALREVFNNMSDGVIVLNEDGSILDMNNKAKAYLSSYYNPKIDVNIFDIILNMSSKIDNVPLVLGQVKEAIKRANRDIHIELTVKNIPLNHFSIKLGPIYDSRKRAIGHIVNVDDITNIKKLLLENEDQNMKLHEQNEELEAQKEELEAQKQELEEVNSQLTVAYKELQEAQSQLIQTEKMAALGQLVAGVAHEINTPLGSINSNIEITKLIASKLLNISNNNPEIDKLLEKFNKMNEINSIACNRILEIVRSLKNFSRLDESEFQKANIHDGIDSTLILLNNQLKNRITVHKNYCELPEIECYPNQLNQVFMNILVNASQAIEDKGDIYINTCVKDDMLCIEFIDSGKGINQTHLDKVFDPGFTTKGVGVGTGLGLSISYKIIQKHNGKISVSNTESLGAKFLIQLPLKFIKSDKVV